MTAGRMKKYITFLLIGIYELAVAIVDACMEMLFFRALSIVLAVLAGVFFTIAFYCFVEGDDEW